MDRREAVILDLDGTACDVRPVRHYLQGPVKNYDAFHKASAFCEPNHWVLHEVRYHHEVLGRAVVVFSGRMRTYALMSYHWLTAWEFPFEGLYTRAEGDYRKDVLVKDDMWTEASQWYNFVYAWDDTPEISDLWASKGMTVTRVAGRDE